MWPTSPQTPGQTEINSSELGWGRRHPPRCLPGLKTAPHLPLSSTKPHSPVGSSTCKLPELRKCRPAPQECLPAPDAAAVHPEIWRADLKIRNSPTACLPAHSPPGAAPPPQAPTCTPTSPLCKHGPPSAVPLARLWPCPACRLKTGAEPAAHLVFISSQTAVAAGQARLTRDPASLGSKNSHHRPAGEACPASEGFGLGEARS